MRDWIIILTLLFFAVAARNSEACSCTEPVFGPSLFKSNAVFEGKVRDITDISDNQVIATFEVYRVWSGLVGRRVNVVTSLHSASCGYKFVKGMTYYVVAGSNLRGGLGTGLCSGNRRVDQIEDVQAILGEPKHEYLPQDVRGRWR